MRNLIRVFLVAVVVAALMPPVPAYATQYEYEVDYYTGCDATFSQVGISLQDCDGNWTYYGATTGDWKRVFRTNCSTDIVTVSYWHNCNGTWVVIGGASMGACDLDC